MKQSENTGWPTYLHLMRSLEVSLDEEPVKRAEEARPGQLVHGLHPADAVGHRAGAGGRLFPRRLGRRRRRGRRRLGVDPAAGPAGAEGEAGEDLGEHVRALLLRGFFWLVFLLWAANGAACRGKTRGL